MIDIDFERLRSIGWNPALLPLLNELLNEHQSNAEPRLLRLTELHRDTLSLHDGEREFAGRALPRLLRTLADAGEALAVGDWLLAAPDGGGAWWVQARLAPLNHIVRRDADGRRHAIVSNIDSALFVMGLDDDFNPRRLERYLLLARAGGVAPVVVLSKADLVSRSQALREAVAADEIDALRERIGIDLPVLAVDGTSPSAAIALAPWLGPGQTVVLLGSSGAGKSTLTNTLAATRQQDTGPVRVHDGRGQHTTTSRSLHRLPGGACVIDTPGLRTQRPDIDAATLASSFDDIGRLAARCRFRDCRHADEPGCAVRDGVPADRLRNYQKLRRELRRDSLSALERQQQLSEWKARGRGAELRMRMKRGLE